MNKTPCNQTLDIDGSINSYTKVGGRVVLAVACVGLGRFLWLHEETSMLAETSYVIYGVAVISFIIAGILPYNGHTYLDFTDRQVVALKHYCGFKIFKRCRPLTDFSQIVVRHLCHPGGEGPDTYTGSVGLKPLDGKAVFWVKSFPATEDEFPQATREFARKLKEMTGLPSAPASDAGS